MEKFWYLSTCLPIKVNNRYAIFQHAMYFKLKKQRNLKTGSKAKHIFSLQPTRRNKIGLDTIAEMIEQRTSLSRGDVVNTLITLQQIIGERIQLGEIVELDHLGTFKATFKSRGVEDPKTLTVQDLSPRSISFLPKPELKRYLEGISYQILQEE